MNPAFAVYLGLILARVGAFVAVMPLFASQTPRLVRGGFALALASFYAFDAMPGRAAEFAQLAELQGVRYALVILREGLLGSAMGFAFGLFLLPARFAGEFVTAQIGLNVSPHVGPTGAESAGPLTQIFETMAGMLFLAVDGHLVVLGTLHASFAALPLGGTALPPGAAVMTDGLAAAHEMGMLLAGPLALCLFLLSVTMAVMARTAPQLNIYSVGFSLQVTVVLFGALLLLPELAAVTTAFLGRTSQMLPALTGG